MRKVAEGSKSEGISKTIWFPSLHCDFASDSVRKMNMELIYAAIIKVIRSSRRNSHIINYKIKKKKKNQIVTNTSVPGSGGSRL